MKICSKKTLVVSVITSQTVNKGRECCVACYVAWGKFGYPTVESKAGAAAACKLWPRLQSLACDCFRKRDVLGRAEKAVETSEHLTAKPSSRSHGAAYGPMSFSEKKLVGNKNEPQNAEFLMCSYGIFYLVC